jgi:hypothetical protein
MCVSQPSLPGCTVAADPNPKSVLDRTGRGATTAPAMPAVRLNARDRRGTTLFWRCYVMFPPGR